MAASARPGGETLTLDAVVASADGTLLVREGLTGPASDPRTVGERLAERLLAQGAAEILRAGRAADAST